MILCFRAVNLILNVCSSAAVQVLFKHLFLESWVYNINLANWWTGCAVSRQTLKFRADCGHRRLWSFAATNRFEKLTCAFYRSHRFLTDRVYTYRYLRLIKCVNIGSDYWRWYKSLSRWSRSNSHLCLLTTLHRWWLDFWFGSSHWCKEVLFIGSCERTHGLSARWESWRRITKLLWFNFEASLVG